MVGLAAAVVAVDSIEVDTYLQTELYLEQSDHLHWTAFSAIVTYTVPADAFVPCRNTSVVVLISFDTAAAVVAGTVLVDVELIVCVGVGSERELPLVVCVGEEGEGEREREKEKERERVRYVQLAII